MDKDKIAKAVPAIFVGAGMAFGGVATAEGIKATFDICKDGYDLEYFNDSNVPLSEKAKVLWRYYWPTLTATGAAAGCFMGSVHGYMQAATLAGTASYWKKYAKDYRVANRELYGEENDRNVEKTVTKSHILQNPPPKKMRDPNALLMYDPITDQYFEATPGELEFAEKAMNDILSKGCPVEYWFLLKHFRGVKYDLPICNDIGWHLDDTYEDYHYYNESFFGHIQFKFLDEFEDTQYGRVHILRCNLEPMLNVELDADVAKDSQELHCL